MPAASVKEAAAGAVFLRGFSSQHRWRLRLRFQACRRQTALSTASRVLQPQAGRYFKHADLLQIPALPDLHAEADLRRSLLQHQGKPARP